ncbi:conserved hypothetical protein [Coccidioides posadasii str. Silveira]|uniref:Uncharacterized protein n=1 Tax=Coccidioides posadasii (strain RMSCC 757 / Silveira) TaxID=443226 RepID=E9CV48_COCPS|nr:conserved hypothetical protein [Coccidioides posadasii str. Silveira]
MVEEWRVPCEGVEMRRETGRSRERGSWAHGSGDWDVCRRTTESGATKLHCLHLFFKHDCPCGEMGAQVCAQGIPHILPY